MNNIRGFFYEIIENISFLEKKRIFAYNSKIMATRTIKKIKIQSPQAIAFIKKRLAQKALIHEAIRKGTPLAELKKHGIRLVTPI